MRAKQFFFLPVCVLFFGSMYCQAPPFDKTWSLNTSKSDEFNSGTLHSRWQRITGSQWGASIFDQNYVTLPGTELWLKGDKIGSTYYTGGIQTNNFDYQYGYFEVEGILPYGKGFWPCFWIWGANADQSYTELDILEPGGCQYQYADKNVCGFWYKNPALAPCYAFQTPGCDVKTEFEKTGISNMSTNYHKYAAEWHPGRIIFYLDDEPFGWAYNDPNVPFDPTRVVIDLQIDGFPGCEPNGSTLFPQHMKINWFRYHQLKKDCTGPTSVVVVSNFDFTNAQNFAVKYSYTISNSTVPSGENTTLRAADFIEFTNNFDVLSGTEFNVVPTPCY